MNRRLASRVSRSVNRWQLALFAQLAISQLLMVFTLITLRREGYRFLKRLPR